MLEGRSRQLLRVARERVQVLLPLILLVCLTTHLSAVSDQRLVQAVKHRDFGTVQKLLNEGVDVNASQPDGTTALHWAAHWDHQETAELLIRAGAEINAANVFYGVTPLSLACTNGNAAMARLLLNEGANANASQSTGESVLMTASRTGGVEIVTALLAHGADVNAMYGSSRQTALMWAASEEHPAVVRVLIEHGADVAARSTGGFSPLLFAVRQSNVETVRVLLAAGADVNEVAADGSSPLVVATIRGRTAIAKLLLERDAEVDAAGAGFTALHWAAGSWPTILSGVNGIVSDDKEWRAMAGLREDKLEFVNILLKHGADPNARVAKAPPTVGIGSGFRGSLVGATPFLLAALAGDVPVMRTLVDHGADPHLGTRQNSTPLMVAAGLGREVSVSFVTEDVAIEAVKLVLRHGSNLNAANSEGDTALHGAALIKWNAMVRLLVQNGALVNAENARGETPLTAAEQIIQGGSRVRAQMRTSTGDLLRELGGR